MKIRLGYVDDDDDYESEISTQRPPYRQEDSYAHVDPFDPRFGPRGKPRLRAPSDTSDSSDLDSGNDDGDDCGSLGLFEPTEVVPTLSAVSRQGNRRVLILELSGEYE